jgi:hypothetical protein
MSKDKLIEAIHLHSTPAFQRHRKQSASLEIATPGPMNISSPESVNAIAAGQQQGPGLKELTELPSSYGQTRLTLMGIDPFWIHAYWEVTPPDHEAAMARLGPERASAHWILRFYDVTYIDFDGTNAHGWFDQPVDPSARNWYVNLWSSEKTYCADLGALAPSGRFERACRSNFVHTPRADESPHYQPEWLHVEGGFDKVERATMSPPRESPEAVADSPPLARTEPLSMTEAVAAPEPEPAPRTSAPRASDESTQLVTEADIRKYYGVLLRLARAAGASEPATLGNQAGAARAVAQNGSGKTGPGSAWHEVRGDSTPTLGSFGSGSWAPTEHAAVDLKLNAEMVISGRAQPDQAVQVNGQWLKVNTDGTFSVRLALPLRE